MARPAVSLNSLFLNASPRPVLSTRADPRLVTNLLSGGNGVVFGYDRYYKGTGSDWGDDEERLSTLVFIGRNLPREIIEQGLKKSLRA